MVLNDASTIWLLVFVVHKMSIKSIAQTFVILQINIM